MPIPNTPTDSASTARHPARTRPKPAAAVIALGTVIWFFAWQHGNNVMIGDAQKGLAELRPDARYNQDAVLISEKFALGVDILNVIAEAGQHKVRSATSIDAVIAIACIDFVGPIVADQDIGAGRAFDGKVLVDAQDCGLGSRQRAVRDLIVKCHLARRGRRIHPAVADLGQRS